MTAARLTDRQLNRATLARQMLLARADMDAGAAVEWLIGLQGQVSEGPYQGLWSRLTGKGEATLAKGDLPPRTLVFDDLYVAAEYLIRHHAD